MPRPKSDDSTEVVIRWRDRHETQIRLERLALFYDLPWNKLAAGVLVGHAAAQEKKYGLSQMDPAEELPRVRYVDLASLPPLSRARYYFYTEKLFQLHQATSSEARAKVAARKFVPGEWVNPNSGDRATVTGKPTIIRLRRPQKS